MSSHRKEQTASLVHRAVQGVLSKGLGDPRIRGLLTVTEVTVSPDRRSATVHVSVLPAEYEARSMQGLSASTMKIQRMVNDQLAMRRPPHLRFVLDQRTKKQAEVFAAIREANRELEDEPGDASSDPDTAQPDAQESTGA